MDGLVILVRFQLADGQREAFLERVTQNAATSVAREPGCRRFDVLTDMETPANEVLLYEIYDDAAAFDAHLQAPHFTEFRDAVKDMVVSSVITRMSLREHARNK
jgi:autoinducer 2-degrading protein